MLNAVFWPILSQWFFGGSSFLHNPFLWIHLTFTLFENSSAPDQRLSQPLWLKNDVSWDFLREANDWDAEDDDVGMQNGSLLDLRNPSSSHTSCGSPLRFCLNGSLSSHLKIMPNRWKTWEILRPRRRLNKSLDETLVASQREEVPKKFQPLTFW